MKTQKLAVIVGSALLTSASLMAQELGVDPYGLFQFTFNDPSMNGYEFQVVTPVTVTGLAVADLFTPIPLDYDVPIGLWYDQGALITSATIPSGTPPTLGIYGEFEQAAITPITLLPGYYDVGAYTKEYALSSSAVVAPGINYVSDLYSYGGFADPNSTSGYDGYDGYAWFGANIVLAGSSVPDASSSWVLLTGACLALGAVRRKLA